MTEIEQLHQEQRRKREEMVADRVQADEQRLEQMRQAEIARAKRVEDAASRGETLNELPIDPEALRAITLTSNPGMVKIPEEPRSPEDQSPEVSTVKRETV